MARPRGARLVAGLLIGHLKAEHCTGRNYLKGGGDRMNAVLAAAGYKFSLLPRWLEGLLRALFMLLAKSGPAHCSA